MNQRLALMLIVPALVVSSLQVSSAAFAGCEADTPARPVPQFDQALAPDVSLWPLDSLTGEILLRPANLPEGILRPQVPRLPLDRDSTQYLTQSAPGQFSGHELFQDVAIPGSHDEGGTQSDWVVVAYNAGLEVWDIGSDPEQPTLVDERDGWPPPFGPGEWAEFPGFAEADTYVHAVDVIREGNLLYIGVAGRPGAGFSVWTFNTVTEVLQQVYQDAFNVDALDVSIARDPNGRIYAYVANVGGSEDGIRVYDLLDAASGGLCTEPAGSTPCGVYEGHLGNIPAAQFVSAIVANGETYVAASDGKQQNGLLTFQIWEAANPENPAATPMGASVQRFIGLGNQVSSPQFFTYDGAHYLALVENVGGNPNPDQMRIHDVGHCLDGNGCGSLNAAKATETIKNSLPNFHFLDLSFSDGSPFLHYGMETTGLFGSGFERLWDLGQLPSTSSLNTLPEITDTGGTYLDPCDSATVDYFGDYYVNNEWGLKHFNPRHAVFTGLYLYRAGVSVFDIHVRGGSVQTNDPVIIPGLQSGGTISADTFWLDESVVLDTVVQNCTPGALDWCWLAGVSNPDVDAFPIPAGLDGCDATFDPTHTMTFLCNGLERCANTSISVSAWNESASCADTAATPGSVSYNLKDPEVDATGIDTGGTSFPECQVVSLDATAEGRGAVEWDWLVDGEAIPGCGGSIPAGNDLSGESFGCSWDSSGQMFDSIFADGFESGSCELWSAGCPATFESGFRTAEKSAVRMPSSRLAIPRLKGGGTVIAEFEVRTTLGVVLDSLSQELTFNPVGEPAFAGPLTDPVVNGSGATLQAPATDTTTWTWEVEDPDVAGAPCSFDSEKNCATQDTSVDTVDYLWQGPGTFTYKVSLSNCSSASTVSLTGTVTVQDATQPEIVLFKMALSSIQTVGHPERPCTKDVLGNCGPAGTIYCPTGVELDFDLDVLEEGSFNFSFDWERASLGETPNYGNQAPATVNVTEYVFNHTFGAGVPSPNYPIAAVQFGNEYALEDKLEFGTCP